MSVPWGTDTQPRALRTDHSPIHEPEGHSVTKSSSSPTPPIDQRPPAAAPADAATGTLDVVVSPRRTRILNILALAGIGLSIVGTFFVDGPTLWGLLPIVLYAVLCLLGMDILLGTIYALVAGLILAQLPLVEVANLLGASLAEQITMIGLIIMFGAGVGEILKLTGVDRSIVLGVMRVFGHRGQTAVIFGVMLACLILVMSLGTLAGALAIAAPILLPICSRMQFTRSATASMMFIGGCAGLALAPFAGSNVAIMDAAEVSYGQYVLYGAGPLAILSLVAGLVLVPWMQRRTARQNDFYTAEEAGVEDDSRVPKQGRATTFFLIALLGAVIYATVSAAGTSFPLLALPLLGIVAGLAGGQSIRRITAAFYRGLASMVSLFLLFWLLAALFLIIDVLAPFDVIKDAVGAELAAASPLVFAIVIALLGWVGVPGATAAQVVLLDKVFGEMAAAVGVPASAWVIVLLFASKADTYGPFPNGNMVGAMGLARSTNLKNMMITGWLLLIPACIMYFGILFFETR